MGGEEGGFSGLSGWENLYYRRNVAEDSAFCRLHGTGRLRSGADLGFVRMPLLQLVVACDSELPGAGEKNPVGNAEHSRTPHRLRKEPARGKSPWQKENPPPLSSLKKTCLNLCSNVMLQGISSPAHPRETVSLTKTREICLHPIASDLNLCYTGSHRIAFRA